MLKNSLRFWCLFSLLFLFLLMNSACKKVSQIDVIQTQEKVIFDFSSLKNDYSSDYQAYLMELEVMKRHCQQNCRQWLISVDEALVPMGKDSVVYGRVLDNLDEKAVARKLITGEYSVSGVFLIKDGVQEIKTINFRKIFFIE